MRVEVSKLNGLGNDFLVLEITTLKANGTTKWSDVAKKWCERRRGIGADGLLLMERIGSQRLRMLLYNSDGTQAEMSGNGIRCLVHAAYLADKMETRVIYEVATSSGVKSVEVNYISPKQINASVSMGEITTLDEPYGWGEVGCDVGRPVVHLSLGNPHSVVGVANVNSIDLLAIGRQVPQVNLEVIEAGPEAHAITMRVHERGAGLTKACGTGACASAWAAHQWGMVKAPNGVILVHQPGGDSIVKLNVPQQGHATLVGPSIFESTHAVDL